MVTKFVAEVSSNHNSDLERSLEFVRLASSLGFDAVKFQLFKIDQLFSKEVLDVSKTHRERKKWELPLDFIPELAKEAKKEKIEFSCTPFYLDAVKELAPYVDFFKVASYELLWDDLFLEIAKTGLPIVFSTGMANMDEIRQKYNLLKENNVKDITILHCVSSYPADLHQVNLKVMETYRDEFDCKIGWSDHTVSTAVINRAIHKYDADFVELHIDIDETGEEFSSGHCWLPNQVKNLISDYKQYKIIDGIGEKAPTESEKLEREWRADPIDGLRPLKYMRNELKFE